MSGGRTLIGRRRFPTTWSGILMIVVIICALLQLAFLSLGDSSDSGGDFNDSSAAILSMVPSGLHKFLTPRPRNLSHVHQNGTTANLIYRQALNISEMKRNIALYNLQQTVYNEDLFGSLQNDSVVIVVQIHDRITYLRHLIVSLAQARDISQALIVFSHDIYDEEINTLVQSIDFCKVMQIFYPYSIQVHPSQFPGEDPNDCPRDIKREQALIRNCNNALFPDLYGHYREAKFTQTKHHWWWKANRVFNQLDVTRNHTGLVVFLEEDHFVAEDFIHVLKLMDRTCKASCRYCNILSLGTYLKTYNYYGKVEITPWISSKHNMGMAFNRTTWMKIVGCADYFCKYDDYNWDWSLQQVSQNCLKQKLHAMVVRGPRVFHIGECGVHHKKKNCESTAVISKVQKVLKSAKRHLYPDYMTLTYVTPLKKQKIRKGNGGWGDRRDHMLCMGMTLR
ncbi:PREDICTED: alpha-1,6-mannosyl-glycoprotein 2-beta-N-acetylglucosaminyltransferase isoform X2 [Nicrophorus vespilloides]|uniref:Alpha-1,6-mannosyl-glycoprotein 2-beta-N-acetylglucosaminyltransferase n=1 Tax=Nicrophorus vespilloides TaxID=110193 RepID=A0ABM1MRC8_NICVS|nr:PREDICTED: alpha-1,6-mannosyl-glycoprotein 2-beta-N-acetylglucosaminyltransferase isoform X2 [Nicrophorus vespilloides]